MKAHLYLSSLLLFLSTVIFSQNRLSIYYPLWWNEYMGEGTIEEATFTIKPQGIFVEVGMYFTFSFPENNFGIEDSLEIVFDFNLPEEAIVNDSWLWVGDQIVRAEITEIWTAIQTYEEIVNRQQDPSVLYEKPDGGYQLRIFPLVMQETRRVKINYLLPARWAPDEVTVKLPTELLVVSENQLDDFRLLVFPDSAWENYRITEYPNWEFLPVTDPEFGPCLQLNIVPFVNAAQSLHFAMDPPLTPDGLFVGRYTGGEEPIYHLAYFPDSSTMTEKTSRVMAVVHYETNYSDLTRYQIMNILKNSLKERLDEQDFFNLTVCINQDIHTASPSGWLPADDATIDWAFGNIPNVQAGTGKPLLNLLFTAGNIMVDAGQGGEMLLVTNTDEYSGWLELANDAVEGFDAVFNGAFPVHICDFQTKYYETWWNDCDDWSPGTLCYKGNEYFNYQLAALTGGSFFDLLGNGADLLTNLSTQLNAIDGQSAIYELYTDMSAGLCYHRYHVTYLGQSRYLHLPILQVGKYAGEFPMTVEFTAIHDGQIINETFVVEENQVVDLDTLAEESWVGNHLRMLEANDNLVFEAIDLSIQHRVLSKYTAFIALDPALGGEPCFDCIVGGGPVIIETTELPAEDEKKLSAFPNPFREGIAIQLTGATAADVRIYDLMGRLVRILEPADSLWWDGKNAQRQDLPAGVFVVVVTSEKGDVYSLKINKI